MKSELNFDDQRPAYLCGRLFATLENAQRAALGRGINATIADRFFGTASTAPASVFPRLLRGAQPHLQKLRKEREGTYVAIDREIEGIMSHMSEFPKTLTLVQQGLFAMGYYHQRAEHTRRIAQHKQDREEPDDGQAS